MKPPRLRKRVNPAILWTVGLSIFAAVNWSFYNSYLVPAEAASKSSSILSDVKDINTSLAIYMEDSNHIFPPVQSQASFQSIIAPYLGHEVTTNSKKFRSTAYGVDLRYNTNLSNVRYSSIEHPEDVVDLWTPFSIDPKSQPSQYLVGLANGAAKSVKPADWPPYFDSLNQAFPRVSDKFYPPEKP